MSLIIASEATPFCYNVNFCYKAKIGENFFVGHISDVDCINIFLFLCGDQKIVIILLAYLHSRFVFFSFFNDNSKQIQIVLLGQRTLIECFQQSFWCYLHYPTVPFIFSLRQIYRGGHNFFEHPHPGANEKKFGLTFFRFFSFF